MKRFDWELFRIYVSVDAVMAPLAGLLIVGLSGKWLVGLVVGSVFLVAGVGSSVVMTYTSSWRAHHKAARESRLLTDNLLQDLLRVFPENSVNVVASDQRCWTSVEKALPDRGARVEVWVADRFGTEGEPVYYPDYGHYTHTVGREHYFSVATDPLAIPTHWREAAMGPVKR